MIYGTIRKSAFHFVLIVRAFKDAQWFFGPLGAEEFADKWRAGEQSEGGDGVTVAFLKG